MLPLDLHTGWAWFVVIGNGLAGLWALAAWKVPFLRTRALWWFTGLVELAVFVQVGLGVWLVAREKLVAPQFHMFYGFVAIIAVASPILVELASNPHPPERMVATLQLEVARRLMAQAGDEDYGILSLLMQLRYQPHGLFKVPPGCFFPPPDVDSACITLVQREHELLPGLRLVPAPGHTRGSQMVVVETGGRPVIVGGDVAVWFGELEEPETDGQLRVLALDPELVWLAHVHEPWRPGAA